MQFPILPPSARNHLYILLIVANNERRPRLILGPQEISPEKQHLPYYLFLLSNSNFVLYNYMILSTLNNPQYLFSSSIYEIIHCRVWRKVEFRSFSWIKPRK